jgi:CHASE2 domain-containing sensor protein
MSKVFISYSHESDEHADRIQALVEKLRADGVQVTIDLDVAAGGPDEGWPAWSEAQVLESDRVLVACTETYRKRFELKEEPGTGLGATCEARAIRQIIYNSGGINPKFRVVLFSDADRAHIPLLLQSYHYFFADRPTGYNELIAWLGVRATPTDHAPEPIHSVKNSPSMIGPSTPAAKPSERALAPGQVGILSSKSGTSLTTNGASPRPAFRLWMRPGSRLLRGFTLSVGICLLAEAFLWVIPPQAKTAIDERVLQNTYRLISAHPDETGYALIDIDQQSYKDWGEPVPLSAAEAKLIKLVRFAAEGGARLIILDVALSPTLVAALRAYLEQIKSPNSSPVPLILVASLKATSASADSSACPEMRFDATDLPSPAVILASNSLIYQGPNLLGARLWDFACRQDEPEVLPSIPLVTVALLERGSDAPRLLRDWLGDQRPRDCAKCNQANPSTPSTPGPPEDFQLRKVHVASTDGITRVIFSVPMKMASGQERPTVVLPGKRYGPLLVPVPANAITESAAPSNEVVKDRVVVIGGSYREGRDTHATILGDMPGALVLINAIESLKTFGPIAPRGPLASWPLVVLWSFLISLLFVAAGGARRARAATSGVALSLLLLSCLAVRYGSWTGLTVPVVALWAGHATRVITRPL